MEYVLHGVNRGPLFGQCGCGEHSRHSGHFCFPVVPAFRSIQLTSRLAFWLSESLWLSGHSSHFRSIECSKRTTGVANSLQHVAFVLGNPFPRSKTNTLHCHLPDPATFSLMMPFAYHYICYLFFWLQ